jgi:hypothetical protein
MPAPSTLRLLLTGPGREALQEAQAAEPRPEDFLALVQKLERRFPSALAAAAAEQAILRRKARAKFREADRMFFATEALEQATAQPVAEYRAARFASLALVFDLTCGLGGDALALAQVAPVIASDIDRVDCSSWRQTPLPLGPAHATWSGGCEALPTLKAPALFSIRDDGRQKTGAPERVRTPLPRRWIGRPGSMAWGPRTVRRSIWPKSPPMIARSSSSTWEGSCGRPCCGLGA